MPRAEAIVVTTPQPAAQRVAERAAAMVQKIGQTLVGVVENMSGYACPCCGEHTAPFGEGGGARLAAQLGVPLLGEVPLEPALREGADDGHPLMLSAPESPASRAIAGVAERLDGDAPEGARPRRLAARDHPAADAPGGALPLSGEAFRARPCDRYPRGCRSTSSKHSH